MICLQTVWYTKYVWIYKQTYMQRLYIIVLTLMHSQYTPGKYYLFI